MVHRIEDKARAPTAKRVINLVNPTSQLQADHPLCRRQKPGPHGEVTDLIVFALALFIFLRF